MVHAVQPDRDSAGQRMYTDADVERLTLLRAAPAAGRSIGRVARLPTEAIAALVEDDSPARAQSTAASSPCPPRPTLRPKRMPPA